MDNIRFALLCVIGVLCFFLYQAWQTDYAPTASQASAQTDRPSAATQPPPAAGRGDVETNDVPDADSAPAASQAASPATGTKPSRTDGQNASALAHGREIHVVTDTLNLTINLRGGDLRRVALRGVPVSSDDPDNDLDLINDSLPNFFIVQSGLVGQSAKAPDHHTPYQSAKTEYRLADGQDTLRVPLTWKSGDGHRVTKIYTFTRGSYRIGLQDQVVNDGKQPWTLSQYVRFWRTPHQVSDNNVPFSSPFFGVGLYKAKGDGGYQYQQQGYQDLVESPVQTTQDGGWVAMIQHYFIGAAIPPPDAKARFFARPKALQGANDAFASGFIGSRQSVAPGAHYDFKSTLFIGPKLQDQLDSVAPGLGLTVDYGWFTVLAKPIFVVLDWLHSIVGNWGVSIILLTVLIKLLFYKLSETQFRSMARMRKFQPRMAQLKEQYGDDKQQLQAKMMELYKKEGFNPLAGCWPMLVQMPVFISLYWVLRDSVELRHAPFMLWINDLSAPDPYYILPVLFGVMMFLQQKLNATAAMDPMQQRLMQFMPIGLAVFFTLFPAGLVLYWCTNTLLTIAQQWYIYRKLDSEGLGRKASTG